MLGLTKAQERAVDRIADEDSGRAAVGPHRDDGCFTVYTDRRTVRIAPDGREKYDSAGVVRVNWRYEQEDTR